jgi:hypothetical protein
MNIVARMVFVLCIDGSHDNAMATNERRGLGMGQLWHFTQKELTTSSNSCNIDTHLHIKEKENV